MECKITLKVLQTIKIFGQAWLQNSSENVHIMKIFVNSLMFCIVDRLLSRELIKKIN